MRNMYDATLEELVGDPEPDDAPTPGKRGPKPRMGGRQPGTTSRFPYVKRQAAMGPRNVTPDWAGKRPGQHAALPLKPPGRK